MILSSAVSAQKISGTITDQQGNGLDKTSVSLLNAKDSSLVKLSTTDNAGNFSFQAAEGHYLVKATHVGHESVYSKRLKYLAVTSQWDS
jgi:hypothetical protein